MVPSALIRLDTAVSQRPLKTLAGALLRASEKIQPGEPCLAASRVSETSSALLPEFCIHPIPYPIVEHMSRAGKHAPSSRQMP